MGLWVWGCRASGENSMSIASPDTSLNNHPTPATIQPDLGGLLFGEYFIVNDCRVICVQVEIDYTPELAKSS